jgi:hypothetical protein
MKDLLLKFGLFFSAVLFFFAIPVELFAQNVPILDEIKQFLDAYYITETAFLALTVLITETITRVAGLTDKRLIMGVSLGVTLVFALIGFFLDLGIFAEIGVFNLIIFVVTKTFAGNGFYDWLRLFGVMKTKKATISAPLDDDPDGI